MVKRTLRRDLALEQRTVRAAARGLVGAGSLLSHAQLRASTLSGPYVSHALLIKQGLDRPYEALEEIADGVNHLLFHIQEFPDKDHQDYLIAIRFLVLAYQRIKGNSDDRR